MEKIKLINSLISLKCYLKNIVYDLSILSFKLDLIELFLFWYKEIALFFLFIFSIKYKQVF